MKNLIINNLKQQYTYGAVGIQDISLECDANQAISIFSKSEGGKTSLLNSIAKLCPIVSGEIFINGKNIAEQSPKELDILLIHQDGGLFKRRSVYYNLSFPLLIRKVDKTQIKAKITEVAHKLNLQHFLKEKIYMLSSAQKVKVSLARAMLRTASVYLLDNPFKQAPPEERHTLFTELLPHIKALTGAVLFATDSFDEARTIAKTGFILNYGFVIDWGNFDDISKSPRNFTTYNMIKNYADNIITTIAEEDSGIYINILGKKVYLDESKLRQPIYIGNQVILSFSTKASAEEGIVSEFNYIEYHHNTPIMHSTIDNISIKTVLQHATLPKYIDIDEQSIKLFDINSEKNIYY